MADGEALGAATPVTGVDPVDEWLRFGLAHHGRVAIVGFRDAAIPIELAPLGEALRRRGSTLQPVLVQRDEWFNLEVAHGDRRCEASSWSVVQGHRRIEVDSLDAAAAVICELLQ